MKEFKKLVADVLNKGELVKTSKGNCISLLGAVVEYDVSETLPAITGKKTNIKWALAEMTMFMKGIHHTDFLKQYGAEALWEKQGLSEDNVTKRPRPFHEVTAEFAEKSACSMEEADTLFKGLIEDFQLGMNEIHEKANANPEHTPEFINELDAEVEKLRTVVEEPFTRLDIKLYSDHVLDTKGELGPIYGKQWLSWVSVNPNDGSKIELNQIKECLWKLENIPDSRQILMTAWNPAVIARETFSYDEKIKAGFMGQPPCHILTQFITRVDPVSGGRILNAILFIRSNDLMLGHGFNAIGYTALIHLMAAKLGYTPGRLIITIGDAHIYENHLEGASVYLHERPMHDRPTFKLAPGVDIENFEAEDLFAAVGEYTHEAYIPFELNT